jgi:ribonuclease BN (tRNA processing enzyme)
MPELVALGTGDAFGDGGRFQACLLLRDGEFSTLIDCGATSLVALRQAGVDPSTIDAVLLSHFHLDHFGGVPLLVLDGQFKHRAKPLVVAGPAGIERRLARLMEDAYPGSSSTRQRFALTYQELVVESVSTVGPLRITALPVLHTPGSEALGFRVAVGGRVLAYSGDTAWTDALVPLGRSADLFICEAYSFEKRIPYHLSYDDIALHLAEIGAARVVLIHPGPDMLLHAAESRLALLSDGQAISL